jgi:hypothetical protein
VIGKIRIAAWKANAADTIARGRNAAADQRALDRALIGVMGCTRWNIQPAPGVIR